MALIVHIAASTLVVPHREKKKKMNSNWFSPSPTDYTLSANQMGKRKAKTQELEKRKKLKQAQDAQLTTNLFKHDWENEEQDYELRPRKIKENHLIEASLPIKREDGRIERVLREAEEAEEEEEEEEEEDVAVYQVDFNSYLHPNSTLTLLQFHGNDNDYFTSLITEPRFRISQSVSEKIRNRNLSLLRVNTI